MEDWVDYDEETEPTLDKEFLVSLKEIKVLMDRDKEHRNIVCSK